MAAFFKLRLFKKRTPDVTKTLQKKGSIIGSYLLQDKPFKRQPSSAEESELTKMNEGSDSFRTLHPSFIDQSVEQMHTQSKSQRVFKVVFLGNSGVGKSSFIQHCCTGHFHSNMSSTVGVDFQMKTFVLNSTTITIQLWDTAGQERYRSITEQYYRKADGVLAVYDISHSASFTAVRGWMDLVKEKVCEGTVLMLVGNKLDLADNCSREVMTAEGQNLAEQYQALFYECSAKTGEHMEKLMVHLAW